MLCISVCKSFCDSLVAAAHSPLSANVNAQAISYSASLFLKISLCSRRDSGHGGQWLVIWEVVLTCTDANVLVWVTKQQSCRLKPLRWSHAQAMLIVLWAFKKNNRPILCSYMHIVGLFVLMQLGVGVFPLGKLGSQPVPWDRSFQFSFRSNFSWLNHPFCVLTGTVFDIQCTSCSPNPLNIQTVPHLGRSWPAFGALLLMRWYEFRPVWAEKLYLYRDTHCEWMKTYLIIHKSPH